MYPTMKMTKYVRNVTHFFTQFGLKCPKLLPLKNLKMLAELTVSDTFYTIIKYLLLFSRCQKKLTVGVTDESMLKSKKLNDLIEPVEKRIEVVSQFLKEIRGNEGTVYIRTVKLFAPVACFVILV